MKKWIFLFCVCAVYVNAVPFYKTPSVEAAYEWLQAQKIDEVTEEDRPYVLSLAATFIAQIIKVHPEYIECFAQNFAHFSPQKQLVFWQAFSTLGIQDLRIQGTEVCHITPLSKLNNLKFKTGHDFDLMVVSFFATGDELFLSQPMAFLNSDPELLFFAYEWNNRQYITELLKQLTGQTELPDEAEFSAILHSWPQKKQEQFVLRLAAWKCLDLIKSEDPSAEEKISQLCKTNQALDYQGTLSKILN